MSEAQQVLKTMSRYKGLSDCERKLLYEVSLSVAKAWEMCDKPTPKGARELHKSLFELEQTATQWFNNERVYERASHE